jgi:hypothetical protein
MESTSTSQSSEPETDAKTPISYTVQMLSGINALHDELETRMKNQGHIINVCPLRVALNSYDMVDAFLFIRTSLPIESKIEEFANCTELMEFDKIY